MMKALALILVFLPFAHADRLYGIRPGANTSMELIVEKTGLLKGKTHLFVFSGYQGELRFDRDRPETSTVRVDIESRSLACKDTWVSEKDLKKIEALALNEMLAVSQHSTLIFVSRSIKAMAANRFQVDGDLGIRGIVKPASVEVTLEPQADGSVIAAGSSVVRMTAYGLKPPTAAFGAIGTKDEMRFQFKIFARPE